MPVASPPGESISRMMRSMAGSSAAVRMSVAKTSTLVAPLMRVIKLARRKMGPVTGTMADVSRWVTVRVLSSGRPNCAATASGPALVRSATAAICSRASGVIAHGERLTRSMARVVIASALGRRH